MSDDTLQVEKLSFSYNKAVQILDQVCFQAEPGHCVAILGNNGAGKSTMIKCIDRILKPCGGLVYVSGREVGDMTRQQIAQEMSYVAQNGDGGRLTVYDSVLLGRKPYIKLNPTREDYAITEEMIRRMGLEPYQLRYMDELSGGEAQKVLLARALTQQPQVLMLDEPTSNLDLRNQYEVMQIIHDIAIEQNICVIIVIHDLNLALRYCDRFLFIKDAQVYSYGTAETVNRDSIREVYGMEVAIEEIRGYPTVVPL